MCCSPNDLSLSLAKPLLCCINFCWIINIFQLFVCLHNVSQLNIENTSTLSLSFSHIFDVPISICFDCFLAHFASFFSIFIFHFCGCESNWGYQLSVICIFELKIAANASFTYTHTPKPHTYIAKMASNSIKCWLSDWRQLAGCLWAGPIALQIHRTQNWFIMR